jgi:uncharacterized membrane protein
MRLDGTLNKALTAILLVCLSGAVGATIYIAATPKIGERFTELYILGPSGKAESYPTNLTLGESGTVIIGVVNHEYESVSYKVVIRLDNETIGAIDSVELDHDVKWEQNYIFTPEKAGERMKLEFLLLREGVDEPYRSLHLWITVRPKQ